MHIRAKMSFIIPSPVFRKAGRVARVQRANRVGIAQYEKKINYYK
jgi:hypothetical protein